MVSPARLGLFRIYGSYVAVTRSSQNAEVRARVDHFVEVIEYQEGSFVEQGDPLCRALAGGWQSPPATP